jgi:hypothetical protein
LRVVFWLVGAARSRPAHLSWFGLVCRLGMHHNTRGNHGRRDALGIPRGPPKTGSAEA